MKTNIHISISLEEAPLDMALAIAQALQGGAVAVSVMPSQQVVPLAAGAAQGAAEAPKEAEGDQTPTDEAGAAAAAAPEAEAPATAEGAAAADAGEAGGSAEGAAAEPVPELIATLDAKLKRTATVTLADNVTGKDGDYVKVPDGSEAVIMAMYRGRAVVMDEHGTYTEFKGSDLTFSHRDEPDAGNAAQAPAADGAKKMNGPVDATAVRAILEKVQDKLSRQQAADLIRKHGNGAKISEIPAAGLANLYAEAATLLGEGA